MIRVSFVPAYLIERGTVGRLAVSQVCCGDIGVRTSHWPHL